MKNFSDKRCRENQNTHLVCNKFFRQSCLYGILWENFVEPNRQQLTIWRMRISCWIPDASNTLRKVTLTVLPLQQWLHERA